MEDIVKMRRELITQMDKASQKLTDFCKPHRNDIGLVSDAIRQSDEYRELSAMYEITKHNLAAFNKRFNTPAYKRAFKAETMQHYSRA